MSVFKWFGAIAHTEADHVGAFIETTIFGAHSGVDHDGDVIVTNPDEIILRRLLREPDVSDARQLRQVTNLRRI